MTESQASARIVFDRLEWVDRMVAEVRALPLADREAFCADNRNGWTAESFPWRSLKALSDLGRHILAKCFGVGVSEYPEVAQALFSVGILTEREADRLRQLVGCRYHHLIHYCAHEISEEEFIAIIAEQLGDVESIASGIRRWLIDHPEALDRSL